MKAASQQNSLADIGTLLMQKEMLRKFGALAWLVTSRDWNQVNRLITPVSVP
jgi:hypothetical protein